jgi:hypothetical protein
MLNRKRFRYIKVLSFLVLGSFAYTFQVEIAGGVNSRSVVGANVDVIADTQRLDSPDPKEREDVAYTLCGRGFAAGKVIPELLSRLKDEVPSVRAAVARTMGCITLKAGLPSEEIIKIANELVKVLSDSDARVRFSALMSLGEIAEENEGIDPKNLQSLLEDPERDVRFGAAYALAQISGQDARQATQILLDTLQSYPGEEARAKAALALGKIKPTGRSTIDSLARTLAKEKKPLVRRYTINTIGEIGISLHAPISRLMDILLESANNDADESVRAASVDSLVKISESLRDARRTMPKETLDATIKHLSKVLSSLESSKDDSFGKQKADIRSSLLKIKEHIAELSAQRSDKDKLKEFLIRHVWQVVLAIIITAYLLVYGLVYLFNPRLVLYFPSNVKIPRTEFAIPLGFLRYQSRVLDAWVTYYISDARQKFAEKETVKQREVHIPLSIKLNDAKIFDFEDNRLQQVFEDKRWFLLIYGESGTGKTSIACQLAKRSMSTNPTERFCKHLMLPVLVEQELDLRVEDGKSPLKELVLGQLQQLGRVLKLQP